MLYYIHRFREAGTGQETTQAAEYPVAFCWFLGIGHTWP
jgi:poly(3-hydroxybutyrate) depolymerase